MAACLMDKQKKKIIADYVESGSYRATAKKYGVSAMTVKRICEKDTETLQKVTQKKEQNTADMIAYMESRKEQAKEEICAFFEITDKTLDAWCKREYKESFSVIFSQKRGKGKISLRRNQFRLAEKMQIWLYGRASNILIRKSLWMYRGLNLNFSNWKA